MSKKILGVGLAIAGAALMFTGVGAPLGAIALGAGLGSISVATVIGVGLMVASNVLLGPSVPKMPTSLQDGGRDRLHANLDPTTPRKIVFGITAMATDVRYQAFTGANQEYLEQIVCVASHEVQSIDEIWLDNEKAWTAAGGAQGRYAGYLTVATRLVGTSTNGIAIDGVWTASCTLTGCAYVHVKSKLTGNSENAQSPFGGGVTSRMTIRGKGAKVYDPRLDSTVAGGAGTQRANDQATWAWSDTGSRTPALQELWYELGWKINGKLALGKGVPPARLGLADYAVAANACDESVTLADLSTEPRYRSDGVLSEGDDPSSVREALCATMNAVLRDAGGKLSLTVLVNDLATPVASFDENDVQGAIDWQQTPELHAIFNVVRGRRIDPSDNALYQPVDFAEVRLASPDGIDRISSVDYPLVQSNGQAQRLAKQRLQRNQYQGRLQLVGKPSWWRLNLGQVFQLTHPTFGWTNKLFRCAAIKISRTGETEIVAVEEHAAIYAWDKEEKAAVTPGAPTIYDPTNDPLLNPNWGVIDGTGKPEDGATKSRVFRQTTAPAAPTLNDTWVDISLTPNVTKVWDGAAWQPAANLGARLGENTYGFGGLAGKSAVDLATGEVLNKSLATLDGPAHTAIMSGAPNLIPNGSLRLASSVPQALFWSQGPNWYLSLNGGNEGNFLHCSTGGTNLAVLNPFITLYANATYTLQAEMFAVGMTAGSFNIDVEFYDSANAIIGYSPRLTAANGANWAKRFASFATPAGTVKGKARIFTEAATNTSAAARRLKLHAGSQQTPFSDEATVDAEVLMQPGTGRRLADGRNQTSNRNFGLRSLYTAPTITGSDAGTTATIDITASSYASDWGATISYPVAQFTGLAFSTKYYIWRNQPDPSTAGDSYGISTSFSDALGVGKTYMGYCTTPADGAPATGGGTGGTVNCVDPDMWVELEDGSFKRARHIVPGDRIVVLDYATLEGPRTEEVESNHIGTNEKVRLTTESGASLTLSLNTPITLRSGRMDIAANAWRHLLPVKDRDGFRWERCVNVEHVGVGEVSHIRCHQATYAAGAVAGASVFTHNPEVKP